MNLLTDKDGFERGVYTVETRVISIETANKLLAERLSLAYSDDYGKVENWVASNKQKDIDTHKIYYYTEVLEEEVAPCDHELIRTKMTRNPQLSGKVLIASCEVENKFCPECGVKLND